MIAFFEELLAQNIPTIEWWAVGIGLVYVILAGRSNNWCWPFAFVSSLLWSWQVYYAYNLYFDTFLNLFYAVMAIVGLYQWTLGGGQEVPPINKLSASSNIRLIGLGLAVTLLLSWLAEEYTDAALPMLDALTTVFSIIGTFLLIRRSIDNWLYLLVMDVIYVYLYFERGSLLFALLFVLYSGLALWGYFSWRKAYAMQELKHS